MAVAMQQERGRKSRRAASSDCNIVLHFALGILLFLKGRGGR